jgi:small subunit ribosomal protein S2
VRETHRLGVPVIGLVDTNADPDEAEYVIPGNDDAIRACDLVTRVVADGVAAGRSKVTTSELAAAAEPAPDDAPQEAAQEAPAATEEPEPAAVAAEAGAEGGETS